MFSPLKNPLNRVSASRLQVRLAPANARDLRVWALMLALATVAHRLFLAANQFILSPDTGTLGLMALNILDGERPLFLYGFSYAGAPMAYLTALSFRLFGTSLFTLALPTALLAGLWVWISYLLFRRIAGPLAGLAAALLFAFPDRLTSWHTHTPYASYGGFLMLAALILWLAVEIEARDPRAGLLAAWMALLGTVAGLAFWTNAMIAPYLLLAAVPVLIHLRRHRFHPARLAACLPAAGGFILAASPVWLMAGRTTRGSTLAWNLNFDWMLRSFRILVTDTIPLFFEWSAGSSGPVRLAGWLFLAAGLAAGLWSWTRPCTSPRRWRAALPPLLMVLFLACFLPHAKAHEPTPRYLLPLWTMFLPFAVALPLGSASRPLRRLAGALLALWLTWNLYGTWTLAQAGRPNRAERLARRAAIAAAVEHLGARHATLLGDYYFQAEANGMTFLTDRRITFTAAGRERYLPAAQAAEHDPVRIVVCQQDLLPAARASLAALAADWRETPIDDLVTLLHDLRPARRPRRLIPADTITVQAGAGLLGHPAALTDGNPRTALQGDPSRRSCFTLDLGRERILCGLDLLPVYADGLLLPTHGQVELSRDGEAFVVVIPWQARIPIAYTAGTNVYLGGGQGRIAFSFAPQTARFVRFTGASPHGSPLAAPVAKPAGPSRTRRPAAWLVSEVRIFETVKAAPSWPGDPVRNMIDYLTEMEVGFVACDRWLAARLQHAQRGATTPIETYPLFEDPGHLRGDGGSQTFWRFTPSPRTALVVEREFADVQTVWLRQALGRSSPWIFSDHGDYVSFVFQPPLPPNIPSLTWDGAMLLW